MRAQLVEKAAFLRLLCLAAPGWPASSEHSVSPNGMHLITGNERLAPHNYNPFHTIPPCPAFTLSGIQVFFLATVLQHYDVTRKNPTSN